MNNLQQELVDRVRGGLTRIDLPQSWLSVRTGYSEKHISLVLAGKAIGSVAAFNDMLQAIREFDA